MHEIGKHLVFAWVALDPTVEGLLEIKHALLPSVAAARTLVKLADTRREPIDRDIIERQLQAEADRDGQRIQLATFQQIDTLKELRPRRGTLRSLRRGGG